ncbi:unnamed protein product [Allacma fusca]|uniref:THAP-type domain-containing protein n=1 Tax=Allacma fusca TaxID=39272 RepID=A0A8J2LJC1_9HEXA|nr:unnamed protein product [Allacma fusca]
MPFTCAVAECVNSKTHKLRRGGNLMFHRFPQKSEISKLWLSKCKRKDSVNVVTARICSDHFSERDYDRDLRNELLNLPTRKILKCEAVPSIFDFRNLPQFIKSDRENRVSKRASRLEIEGLLSATTNQPQPSNALEDSEDFAQDNSIETVPISNPTLEVTVLEQKLDAALKENYQLDQVVQKQRLEIIRLRTNLRSIKLKQLNTEQSFRKNTRSAFSPCQFKKLAGQKQVNYEKKDSITAMAIRNVSLKAYKNAKDCLGLPLP